MYFEDEESVWARPDYAAIAGHGYVSIAVEDWERCAEWLALRHYRVATINCSVAALEVKSQLGRLLRWEERFGCRFEHTDGSIATLRDGFGFHIADAGGVVLNLYRPDLLWTTDPIWTLSLIALGIDYSRRQIAGGRRFFTTLVLPPEAPMIGHTLLRYRVQECRWPAIPQRTTD